MSDQSKSYLQKILSFLSSIFLKSTLLTGASAASNQTSAECGSARYKYVSVQFIATSLNATDGVFKLQDSNDGTNWNDISGATITVASGTSSNMIRYTAFTADKIRVVWTKGSNSTGTISATAIFK